MSLRRYVASVNQAEHSGIESFIEINLTKSTVARARKVLPLSHGRAIWQLLTFLEFNGVQVSPLRECVVLRACQCNTSFTEQISCQGKAR